MAVTQHNSAEFFTATKREKYFRVCRRFDQGQIAIGYHEFKVAFQREPNHYTVWLWQETGWSLLFDGVNALDHESAAITAFEFLHGEA